LTTVVLLFHIIVDLYAEQHPDHTSEVAYGAYLEANLAKFEDKANLQQV